jgi:hypothetical protein
MRKISEERSIKVLLFRKLAENVPKRHFAKKFFGS